MSEEIQLDDYINLIHKLAIPYARRERTLVRDSEAFSEGLLAFVSAKKNWVDGGGAQFSTYLYIAINRRLWTWWTKKESKHQKSFKLIDDFDGIPDPIDEYGIDVFEKVRKSIDRFPEHSRERMVLELRLEGFNFSEIGRKLQFSAQNAHRVFHKNVIPILRDMFEVEMDNDRNS